MDGSSAATFHNLRVADRSDATLLGYPFAIRGNSGGFVLGPHRHTADPFCPAPRDLLVEAKRPVISDARAVQAPHDAPQHMGRDSQAARRNHDDEVHSATGAERLRRAHQGAAAADVDDLHLAPGPQRCPDISARRRRETNLRAAIFQDVVHVRDPLS